ncbi:RTM1 protein, partial [Colletotrichum orchidophilum]
LATDGYFLAVPGVKPSKDGAYLWPYFSSKPAAILFVNLLLGSFIYIGWKIWKTRPRFCIVFALGCLFEVIGHRARASAHDKTDRILTFAPPNMFVIVAPVLFAISTYVALYRFITSIHAEKFSIIQPSSLTKTLILGDLFVLRSRGGVIIIGLIIQIFMFGLCYTIVVILHCRMRRAHTPDSLDRLIPW